ncbi:MAG TPA: DUF4129 domain-containing protein, partial [Dehalococcoidia bacterium]|nr:DUF4129 domain-containing protein [Dehalococcoidia bacterium]
VWGIGLSLLLFYAIVRVDFFGDWRFWDFTWADALFNHTEATLNDKANAVIAVPVLWLLWMRGVLRGQHSLIFEEVVNSFAFGVLVVAIAELFAPAVDAPSSVGQVAVPYIAVGLLTIGFAHASRAEKDFGRSFGPAWIAAVGGAVVLIGLVALIFVIIDLGTVRAVLAEVSLAATTAILHFLAFLAWPIEQFFYGLFKVIKFLVNLYGGERVEPEQQPLPEGLTDEERPDADGGPPGWIRLLARILVGGSVSAAVLFFIAILFLRYSKRGGPDEVKESTYQEGRLASDLGDMLGSLLGRLRPSIHFGDHNEPVRKLYLEMLAAGADRGVERRPAETPLELSPRLGQTFSREPTQRITDAFDESRYGGVSPPAREVQRLREEWERSKR